jgi:hypothetical protein
LAAGYCITFLVFKALHLQTPLVTIENRKTRLRQVFTLDKTVFFLFAGSRSPCGRNYIYMVVLTPAVSGSDNRNPVLGGKIHDWETFARRQPVFE